MQLLNFLYPALLALLVTPSIVTAAKQPKDAILLSKVKSLTLRANAKTSHRRVSAVPQLSCKGPGCKHHTIDVMRCTNQGSDYSSEDIQWSCVASLPEEVKLGSTDVICEGYANRDDEYVLKGSCGVEYRLLLTDKGEERYGSGGFWGSSGSGKKKSGDELDGWTWEGVLFMLVFVGIAGWILYSLITGIQAAPGARRDPQAGGGFGGWGGGGGGDDGWDPPPPYPGKRYSSQRTDEGWRPGFWSGAMGGAAAGYMAGNRGQRQPAPQQSSWFGGGNSGSSWGGPSRSSGSSSSSSARHESTGFGSTSRR